MIKKALFPFILTAPLVALAFVEEPVNEKVPLAVEFSTRAHNRVTVKDGTISRVLGDESLFEVSIDKSTGQAFISLRREVGEFPATLTVVTGSGSVQDLVVTSNPEKLSEFVILKEQEELEDEEYRQVGSPHTPSIDFLNALLSGKIPEGYGKVSEYPLDHFEVPRPLDMVAVQAIEGPFERVVIYRLINTKRRPIQIDELAIKRPEDFWVFVGNRKLSGNAETFCIVSTSKEAKAQ
jgi:hypothetical protein